jgi:hypothetical protein
MAYHLKPFRKLTVGSTAELKLQRRRRRRRRRLLDGVSWHKFSYGHRRNTNKAHGAFLLYER